MNFILKIVRYLFLIFRSFCFFLALVVIALQFSFMQTFVIKFFLLEKNQSIKVDGFSGLFPFYFSFDKIDFYTNNQPSLIIRDLDLDWSLLNFVWKRSINIYKLHIDQLEYYEYPSKKEQYSFNFPLLPLGYITSIKINHAVYKTYKKEFRYTINGQTTNNKDFLEFNLQLRNINQQSTVLSSYVKYCYPSSSMKEAQLNVDLTAKEKGGLLNYLFPDINGPINIALKGEGIFKNFKATLTGQLGKIRLSSTVSTQLDKKSSEHINIFSKTNYKSGIQEWGLEGTIKTNQTNNLFKLVNCKIDSNKTSPIKLSGDIYFNGSSLSSKNISIESLIGSNYNVHNLLQFNWNLKFFSLVGKIKSSVLNGTQQIVTLEIPFSIHKAIETLKLNAEGKGKIVGLPPEYSNYADVTLKANLDPQSFPTLPKINFEISNKGGNLHGNILFASQPEVKITGEVFSNLIQIHSVLKKGQWHVHGKSTPPQNQPWAINQINLVITPEKIFQLVGAVDLTYEAKKIEVETSAQLDILTQQLNLESIRISHKDSFIEGNGYLNTSLKDGRIDWHLYSFNLGNLIPEDKASGTVSILGQILFDIDTWIINFSGEFHKLFLAHTSVNSGTIAGKLQLNNKKTIQLSLDAQKATVYNTVIEDFSLNSAGTLDQFSTTVSMAGFADQALKGNIAFSIRNLSILELDTMAIQLGKHKFLLAQPTYIKYEAAMDKWVIAQTHINTTTGIIKFNATILPLNFTFNGYLQNVSSDLLYTLTRGRYFLKGNLNGSLVAYGEKIAPTLKVDLTSVGPRYTTRILGTLQNHSLKANLDIKNQNLNLNLEGTYPVYLSLFPFSLKLNDTMPFYLNLLATGKLDDLQHIFDLNYDKVGGHVEANLSLYGTLDQQTSKGYIKVNNGTYERQNIGLKLNNINLHFNAHNGQFVLSEPTTFLDHKHHSGQIVFATLGIGKYLIPYLNTEIHFKKIHFIDLPQTSRGGMSAFCSGTLKAEGPTNALKVQIRGDISSLEKYIGETEDVPIFSVNLTHQNQDPALYIPTNSPETAEAHTQYDIDLSLNRKFHIFGQGLDSTWKGRLIIQGTSEKPVYKGQFVLQDGQLRILDRFFEVQRGEIFFDGDLSPNLYIESYLNLQDMRVKIILEGDAASLKKRLVSDKNLSEQEILQKLFFNRPSVVSQTTQALNYLAASTFVSSFIDIGFYQQEDPLTHVEHEFVSIKKEFSKKLYGKIDYVYNNKSSDSDTLSIAAGAKIYPQTKTELKYSPDKNSVGVGVEWSIDF